MIVIKDMIVAFLLNPYVQTYWIIRICIALLQFAKQFIDLRSFELDTSVDETGFILISVENRSHVPIHINQMQLVLDKSLLSFILRRVIGINSVIKLRELSWKKYLNIPIVVSAKSTSVIHAQIEDKKYSLIDLTKRLSPNPIIRIEIAGRCVLKKLVFSKSRLGTVEDDPEEEVVLDLEVNIVEDK